MDIHTQPAAPPISLWTGVRTEGQLNLATGAQLVNVQLRGEAEVDPSLVVLRRPPRWRATEALDQDGQPIQHRREVDGGGPRVDVRPIEYAEAYLAGLRGDAPRRLPIELQLTDLPQRPRVIRKLTVVGEVPAIRETRAQLVEVPAFDEPVPAADGVAVTVREPEPLQQAPLRVVVRIDPLVPEAGRPLVIGAGLLDATGHTADAVAVDQNGSPGTLNFRFEELRELTPPLRVRLIVATGVGPEQITCVARDIPIP